MTVIFIEGPLLRLLVAVVQGWYSTTSFPFRLTAINLFAKVYREIGALGRSSKGVVLERKPKKGRVIIKSLRLALKERQSQSEKF